jgi:3-oxoacyl-[acyl-carrier protein] reductase/meso-butanediol dehydrogenase/(S,S)-butanediol dehydrogenase/diacetyl reductase
MGHSMIKDNSRTVIITGGTRGIGAAITRAFWEEGYHVVVGARTGTDLVQKLGEHIRFLKMDVRFEPDHRALIKAAIEWTGRLDVFVNCAGLSQWRPINEVDSDFWNNMIDTNLKGTYWGCKVAAENLSEGGCIINISSLAGKRGSANNSVYCASKFGVNGLTQALAKELGPRGIRVNALCPVYVETEGIFDALQDDKSPSKGEHIPNFLNDFARNNAALLRLPSAREVAQLCVFLASSNASAITGQCINVDCGVLPQ